MVDRVALNRGWSDLNTQFFDETRIWVAEHIKLEWVHSIVRPRIVANLHPFSLDVLQFWDDFVSNRRDKN